MIHNIPQPELERHLVNLVSKEPNIEYRTGVSFYYLDQVRCLCLFNVILAFIRFTDVC